MAQVLIVDGDDAISETMRYILEEAGHSVLEMPDTAKAMAYLRSSSSCCVVLFDRGAPGWYDSAFVATIISDEMLLRRHSYICLSTTPAHLRSVESSIFEHLGIPIMAKPFDIADLEAAVSQAAQVCVVSSPVEQIAEHSGTTYD